MLEAAVLLPLAFSAMLNLIYFGSSVMLWRALLFYAVHMTVTALAGFSVAAAVSVCVGTAGESVLFSLAFIAFPSAAVYFLNNTVPKLLFGAPHNSNYALYPSASHNQDISMALSPSGACCRVSICSRSTTTYSSARARWSRPTGSLKSPQTS